MKLPSSQTMRRMYFWIGFPVVLRREVGPVHYAQGKFTHPRRHVLKTHLPWYCFPLTSCWKCKLQFGQEHFLLYHIEEYHDKERGECFYQQDVWLELMFWLLTELCQRLVGTKSHQDLLTYTQEVWVTTSGFILYFPVGGPSTLGKLYLILWCRRPYKDPYYPVIRQCIFPFALESSVNIDS